MVTGHYGDATTRILLAGAAGLIAGPFGVAGVAMGLLARTLRSPGS